MEIAALAVILLAIPASVAFQIRKERRRSAIPLPVARLSDPPDDRAKAMPALVDGKVRGA